MSHRRSSIFLQSKDTLILPYSYSRDGPLSTVRSDGSTREGRIVSISRTSPFKSPSKPTAIRDERSQQERLPSDHEVELIEDEELEAELRSILDKMPASDFLELASEISEEDLIDEEDEEESPDVNGIGQDDVQLNSRTKRGIVFTLKKHLLKGHIRRKLLRKGLRHKLGHKARGAVRHAVRLGVLGAPVVAAGAGGAAGVAFYSPNQN